MIMFDDDQHLKNLEAKCRECLNAAFNAAQQYADTFQPFRIFYRDNETTDVDKIRTDEHSKILFDLKNRIFFIIIQFKKLNFSLHRLKNTIKKRKCQKI